MASRLTRPLITGAIAVIVFLVLRVILPMVLPPAAGQTASFITVFLAILMAYIFFVIVLASILLSGRVPQRVYGLIETVIIAGIVLGVIGMFQPWLHLGFRVGFHLLLISTLAYMVWSHITPRTTSYEEEKIAEAAPNELKSG
jgi:hypothetical protein